IPAMPLDDKWHLITLTYSKVSAIFYLDGEVKAIFNGDYAVKNPITNLEIKGENWPVEMDELAVWTRNLNAAEVADIYNANQPLPPYVSPPLPEKARLIHLWHFDQGLGTTADDSVGTTTLSPIVKWANGKFGKSIEHTWQNGYEINQNLTTEINSKDLSIDFWWQNSAYPNEGRVSLELQNSAGAKIFGIKASPFYSRYYFDGADIPMDNVPYDNQWHHLALVYDSANFYLAFYIDGVEKIRAPKVWFRRPITKLVIRGENWFYDIDELAIWQGALSPAEIKDYYNSGQPHSLAKPEPVILVPGIMGSFLNLNQWQIDPILHTYDDLIEAFLQNGYELNKNLFLFPYNWRQNNLITAGQLKEKINAVKLATGKQKVDLVAHSLGGLAARSYVQSSDYQNDVDQMIFLAVPHQGAPEDYLAWEGASFLNYNWLMSRIFKLEAAEHYYLNLTQYIREQVPSVEQLLPVYNYLQNLDNNNNWLDRLYPVQYPRNEFLENLNTVPALAALKQRVNITNIFSRQATDATITKIKVTADPDIYDNQWEHGLAKSFILGAGDGTVPTASSNSLSGVKTVELAGFDHRGLVAAAQQEVLEELTGQRPENYVSGRWAALKRILLIRVYSPVDFVIISPDGKRLGKNFSASGQLNEIDGAFYSGFDTNAEFATIPEPLSGEYKIKLQATGDGGQYKLSASLIDDNKEIDQDYSGNISGAQIQEFNLAYSAAAAEPLSQPEPMDNVPPVIVINKPVENDKYLHSDNLIINYTATDDFSGIATTTITIDGQAIATTTIDLFDYSLGTHNLVIKVSDKAGNQAQQQVSFTIIANIDSTISDIKEIYDRGWLKDKIYHELLKDGFKLLKIQTKYFDKEQELTEKLLKKTGADSQLTDQQKQKLIEQYTKKLADLKQNRAKAINKSLDLIIKLLNKAKDKNLINQQGYDIILSDVNYLKINLSSTFD
ncbi:MAG: hypothetical protein HYV53_03315, partial [Parcubacteria group bacterium]|nr:hypothetical protein [Parcubacteria group bacterium]